MNETQLARIRDAAKTNPLLLEIMEKLGPDRALKVWKVRRKLAEAIKSRKTST